MASHLLSEKPSKTGEELAPGRVSTIADSLTLPTHLQHSDSEDADVEHGSILAAAPRAAWRRFNGYGRKRVGFLASVKAVVFSSCAFASVVFLTVIGFDFESADLNVLLILLPFAWASHFKHWGQNTTFACACHRWGVKRRNPFIRLLIGAGVYGISMLPHHHPFGKTFRLVRRANDHLPRVDSG